MRHVEPVVAVDPHQLLAVALFKHLNVVVAQHFFTTVGADLYTGRKWVFMQSTSV